MRDLYNKINAMIETIDFSMLHSGFEKYPFALYDREYIYFNTDTLDYKDEFKGNTAIRYDNEYLAIWDLNYKMDDLEVFSSKLIHEMFHCYQLEHNEKRWGNEFDALDYSLDYANIVKKYNETRYLLEAFLNESLESLQLFIKTRIARKLEFDKEVDYDSKTETIEGMAVYIEFTALKQLNVQKYEEAMQRTVEFLVKPENCINIRLSSYHMGVLLLSVLSKLHINIDHQIGSETKTVYELVSDVVELDEGQPIFTSFDKNIIESHLMDLRKNLNVLDKNTSEIIYPDKIIGLDPMNTYKIDDCIVFKHFVMVEINKVKETILGESYIKMNDDNTIQYLKK